MIHANYTTYVQLECDWWIRLVVCLNFRNHTLHLLITLWFQEPMKRGSRKDSQVGHVFVVICEHLTIIQIVFLRQSEQNSQFNYFCLFDQWLCIIYLTIFIKQIVQVGYAIQHTWQKLDLRGKYLDLIKENVATNSYL